MVVVGEKNYKHIDEGPIRKRHARNGDGEADQEDTGMRVGPEYQADIPNYDPAVKPESRHEAMLVWSPTHDHNVDSRIDDYTSEAKNKHGYNTEQALGMLFWHKHSIEKALQDLPNFTPFPEEWTLEDKVLFEQAFAFHGKTFHRIKAMLPDKTIGSLVKYYYSWKKSRSKTSVIDRQAHKVANKRDFNDDPMESEASSGEEMEVSSDVKDESKSNMGKAGFGSRKLMHDPRMRNKRKPPRGMHINAECFKTVAKGPFTQRHPILKQLDLKFTNLRRQVQQNKQALSALTEKSKGGLGDSRVYENSFKPNGKWTNEELLIAVQGVRKFGRDFKAIAEIVGNKSEPLVRSFFVNYKRRFSLDDVLAEYEQERATNTDFADSVDSVKEENTQEVSSEGICEQQTTPLELTARSESQESEEPLSLVSTSNHSHGDGS